MFTKNSEKIEKLEQRIHKLEWIVNNPCPYKVGQKIKNDIIIDVYLEPLYRYGFSEHIIGITTKEIMGYAWRYNVLDKKQKPKL